MSKKPIVDLFTAMSLLDDSEYERYYPTGEQVVECLWDMYFYMIYSRIGNVLKKEEYFKEFEKKFNKLNKEQQEEVKKEYISIIEAQEKKRKNEKVKKKGMKNYE